MPASDDTLNDGGPGPIPDPLDELCTCGHTRGEHHTLDEDCTVIDPECPCLQFTAVNPFGNSPPTEDELRANRDLREVMRIKSREPTRNNTREAVDKPLTHDERSFQMDREPMSPVESMSPDERRESDAVRSETLDNLCACGHRYGDHWTDDSCAARDCSCEIFDALLKPVDLRNTPEPDDESEDIYYKAGQFYDPGCGSPRIKITAEGWYRCTSTQLWQLSGAGEPHPNEEPGSNWAQGILPDDPGAIDHEALERARRLPYTPPLLRKRLLGEDELRQVLTDAGRLDLLQQLPEVEVDRVTTNYGAEHWHEIESLARFPQGSSETNTARDRTTKAIALSLLDLRQSLGATIDNARMLEVIERNTKAIQQTVAALDRIVGRVTGGESGST